MLARFFGERAQLAPLLGLALLRYVRGRLYLSPLYRWRFAGRLPDRLLLAPQDIRTSDPTIATEIYSGRFSLAGKVAGAENSSPFAVIPPSPEWQATLLGFGWLCHLRATESSIARPQARALIDDWMTTKGAWDEASSRPEIMARRVISWLCHSPMILDGADKSYYRRFTRSLYRQIRFLNKAVSTSADGLPRLTVIIALNYAALCVGGLARQQRRYAKWLEEELGRQILPDGGHISRNPGVIIELLLDLLPLRQTFTAREIPPPNALMNAVDRMMPMIRFFRHGDGAFALFNGMGASPLDEIATILAYDDSFGKPTENASYSGYQRLSAAGTTLIMDTGKPPPLEVSNKAHAGCLSFEFSSGRWRILVNCGHPTSTGREWRQAARTTAAHSTAALEDTSSCRIAGVGWMAPLLGELIVKGPNRVTVERLAAEGGDQIVARHDGFRRQFGVIHERSLRLAENGQAVAGADLFRADGKHEDARYAIRFHLHPDVSVTAVESGRGFLLVLPNRETWALAVEGGDTAIEESVYLPDPDGPRLTHQIVVHGRVKHQPRINWSFQCVRAPQRDANRPATPRARPAEQTAGDQ